ncbi:hypothetical protein F444_12073 [Phytophthora nicotianae P1976]|uniref:Uncharacterized protein n=1 Tax=Phytophthora nicotianae P1976 TaxID=1317066 RepID=A0A080ZYA9_PHYNI|nr:hypothetical protein F444_12073 [Phytophthora nicotianae P1976]
MVFVEILELQYRHPTKNWNGELCPWTSFTPVSRTPAATSASFQLG